MKRREFDKKLNETNLSQNTKATYSAAVKQYYSMYDRLTKSNLSKYKLFLIENYSARTVNLRIRAINLLLEYEGKEELKIPFVRIQQKNFVDNVISEADYEYLIKCLKSDGDMYWYFVVRFMCATGARVSELVKIKVEHVKLGYVDMYSKGNKIRRLYIPLKLRTEAIEWLKSIGMDTGFLFLNNQGKPISTRSIGRKLKIFAEKYNIDEDVMYPHSFRHRFAKNFLARYNDLALLSDLMGHSSIEITRVYLRLSTHEQQNIVDTYIDW